MKNINFLKKLINIYFMFFLIEVFFILNITYNLIQKIFIKNQLNLIYNKRIIVYKIVFNFISD